MKFDLHLDYRTILANKAQPVHCALQFKAENISVPRSRPAAFCVVLDRSGSMNGKPLEQARAATSLAIRNLRREDFFALVAFDTNAQVVLPLQACDAKQPLLDAVQKIAAGSSTNLTGGWMLGRDELKKAPADASRRLLLLSDGLLNVGIIDSAQVGQIVSSGLEADKIRTSCLGFGDNYNEKLLADLASGTNGQFYDAHSPESLPGIFAHELDGLQKLAIQNLRVRLKQLDFCESFQLLGDYPGVRLPDGRMEFALGDLVSDEERIVCFTLAVLPLPWVQGQPVVSLEGEKLLDFEILYDEISEQGISSKAHHQIVRIQATPNPDEVKVNETVVGWVAMQTAGLTVRRATDEIAGGRLLNAKVILEDALRLLAQGGPTAQVEQAAKMLKDLLIHIEAGTMSSRNLKEMKMREFYARRSSSSELPSPNPPPPPKPEKPGSDPKA